MRTKSKPVRPQAETARTRIAAPTILLIRIKPGIPGISLTNPLRKIERLRLKPSQKKAPRVIGAPSCGDGECGLCVDADEVFECTLVVVRTGAVATLCAGFSEVAAGAMLVFETFDAGARLGVAVRTFATPSVVLARGDLDLAEAVTHVEGVGEDRVTLFDVLAREPAETFVEASSRLVHEGVLALLVIHATRGFAEVVGTRPSAHARVEAELGVGAAVGVVFTG